MPVCWCCCCCYCFFSFLFCSWQCCSDYTTRALSLIRINKKYGDKKFNAMATNFILFLCKRKRNARISQFQKQHTIPTIEFSVFLSIWLIHNPCIRDSSINYSSCSHLFLHYFTVSFSLRRHIPLGKEFRAVTRIACFFFSLNFTSNKDVSIFIYSMPFCNICIMKSHPISCLSI